MFRRRRDAEPKADPQLELARELVELEPVMARYSTSPPTFGGPTRCPGCSSFGLVIAIEPIPVPRTLNQCTACKAEWTVTRRALRAAIKAGSAQRALAALDATLASPAVLRPSERIPAALVTPAVLRNRVEIDVADAMPTPATAVAPVPAVTVPEPLTLLLVEDDPADAALLETLLEPVGAMVDIHHAWTRREGESLTRDPSVDLVLLDLGLPDSSGLSTIAQWAPRRSVPLMVLSGNDNAGLREASFSYGARQFLHKGGLSEWVAAGEVGANHMVDLMRTIATPELV